MSFNSWGSYASAYQLKHRSSQQLWNVPCDVEEKVDGSQISFGVSEGGELRVRSKGQEINLHAAGMFAAGVETIVKLQNSLKPGYTYRGEYLGKPKHNVLAYSRVPSGHIIIFDIEGPASQQFMDYADKKAEAERIGIEVVPLIYTGVVTPDMLDKFLIRESILGGQKIEGVVVKPVGRTIVDGTKESITAKYVSPAFKEVHAKIWGENNPSKNDILERLDLTYRTEARWQKAVQHLKEAGKITGEMRDMAFLSKEVPADVKKECEEEIKEYLFKWAWPHLQRGLLRGLPEWYKKSLEVV